jgi:uncharacterized membrane protein YgdD (TMEM256/DUF423 family)
MTHGRFNLLAGAALGFLGVSMGAFGAHALKPFLVEMGRLDTFELAVRYQFYHAFALLAAGTLANLKPSSRFFYSGVCFFSGTLFFSGSLYALCFTGLGILGAVTPIGGLLFLIGWAFFFAAILETKKAP